MSFTIGSLFDGSGGFPLAAFMCKGTPVWASEIEPYPIAVTKTRFPNMKHLGSVTDIKGYEVEPVDVITFGSPCQDLSVAGKRAGLKHTDNGDEETTRSGLFMEAVRIIKEMRESTNGEYPRFAVWENVPGAFSSNKGEDFRIVLEELIKIVEPSAVMPEVPAKGWPYADSYCGDGWSLAYRVLDAQYWGVPQRRRRIYLVADFRTERAGEILFKSDGLHGYFTEGRTPWQTVAGDAENCAGAADCKRSGVSDAVGVDSYNLCETGSIGRTLSTPCGGLNEHIPCVYYPRDVCYAVDQGGGKSGANFHDNLSPTLTCTHGGEPAVVYSFDALASNSMKSSNPHSGCRQVEVAKFLDTTDPNPCKNQGGIAILEPIPIHDQDTRFAGKRGYKTDGKGNGLGVSNLGDPMNTLTSGDRHAVAYCIGNGQVNDAVQTEKEICKTLNCMDDPMKVCIAMHPVSGTYQEKVGALCARNFKGVCSQYVDEDKVIVERISNAYSMKVIARNEKVLEEQANPICASDYKDPDVVAYPVNAYGVDCRNATEYPKMTGALQVDCNHNLNSNSVVRTQYIVRRLTPTECARLQGFPDDWGHPDKKTEFTDDEYKFWLNVRNTHAEINGKATKGYTKSQMLTWYNKLHTDSSEYKLWGNGIALPCALLVFEGIAEVFANERD